MKRPIPKPSIEPSKEHRKPFPVMDQTTIASAVPSIVVDQPESTYASKEPDPDATSYQALGNSLTSSAFTRESANAEDLAHEEKGLSYVIPLNVSCKLSVSFEGSEEKFIKQILATPLHETHSYRKIETKALHFVGETFAEELTSREVYFRYGNCTIVGNNRYRRRLPLTSLQDWKIVCKAVIYYQATYNLSLHLEIWREYFSCQDRTLNETSLQAGTSSDIHQLMAHESERTHGTSYITRADLNRAIPPHIIPDLIREDSPRGMDEMQMQDLISRIRSRAPLLLAMFVDAGLHMSCLKELVDQDIDDSALPLTKGRRCHDNKRAPCQKNFDEMIERQGRFRPVRFDKPGEHQDLHKYRVVPIRFCPKRNPIATPASATGHIAEETVRTPDNQEICKKNEAFCGSGSFSTVYRVRLNPHQHTLMEDKDAYLALKEFRHRPNRGTSDFEKESKILNELRKYRHDHIVTHLATWTQDEMYCMLFPYAQCNLSEWMQQNDPQMDSTGHLLWLLEQFKGLGSALKQIHDLSVDDSVSKPLLQPPSPTAQRDHKSGWHHDLKPENILFFYESNPPRGSFRIADWGSGKVNTYRSGGIGTETPTGTLTYEPPEIMLEGKTSRPYDVWSLGCVFLELLVWALSGSEAVRCFSRHRKGKRDLSSSSKLQDNAFWQRNGAGLAILRDSVTDRINWLDQEIARRNLKGLKSVLDLVRLMLNTERRSRIEALFVDNILGNIRQQTGIDFENADMSDDDRNDPILPRLFTGAPGFIIASPTGRLVSPASYADHLNISPSDMMSSPQQMRHRHSLSSSSQRSRTTSNASSNISIRGGRDDPVSARTPNSP